MKPRAERTNTVPIQMEVNEQSANHPIMKCGCAAQGTSNGVPSCIVHECIEIADVAPNLSGRFAKCGCGTVRPSDPKRLAFFEFLGEGAPDSKRRCKCGFYWIAHQPVWDAHVKIVRKWFKIERYENVLKRRFHSPDETKEQGAEKEADFFRRQMRPGETEVYSVEVIGITPRNENFKCRNFEPIGAREFDVFYCGCRGWD